jgi:hypothetical protein
MKKHRIGRLELPWTNLEPPIRNPDYYKNLEKRQFEEMETFRSTDNEESGRERTHVLGSVCRPSAAIPNDWVVANLTNKISRLSLPTAKL